MEGEIDLNQALLVVGIAAACLCLFFLMMVCFLSPHCPLNRCLPCAPKYDELDEYEEDSKCKWTDGFVCSQREGQRWRIQNFPWVGGGTHLIHLMDKHNYLHKNRGRPFS